MKKRPCKNCRRRFEISPQRPDQHYCSRKGCQRARKRAWHKKKLTEDEAYRRNQHDAQKRWREKRPDYYKEWRENHPEYTRRNREKQRLRNRKKRDKASSGAAPNTIAKMDVSLPNNNAISGRYKLIPVNGGEVAKMDAIIVELRMISDRSVGKVAETG